jgi:glutathione S-transferase
VPLDIFDADTLTPEFELINPARSTPVLEVVPTGYLIESNAILAFLADGSLPPRQRTVALAATAAAGPRACPASW